MRRVPARKNFAAIAAILLALAAAQAAASAQSLEDTVQAIEKARVTTRILYVTAHPDDETAGLLAYLSRGLYADVALLTITRGQGGQNAIGPEQDAPLGIVRTTELLAADSHYGTHQFFTRAVDPGFSKGPERTMKIWGDQIPLEDMVRVIRMYRPQVVINGWGGVHFGHGQHQASGLLTPTAIADAADPTKFPEQIAEGLPAWKVSLELRPGNFGFGPNPTTTAPGGVTLPVNDVSPLWGQSYVEMGMDGHAQHRSQGTPSFYGNPFFRRPPLLVVEHGQQGGGSFDLKELAESIASLAGRYTQWQSAMAPVLAAADQDLAAASKSALALDRAAAASSLAKAGKEIAALRSSVAANGDSAAGALYEIDQIAKRIDVALVDDVALPVDTQANRHELVAGEDFAVDVKFLDEPATPAKWKVDPSSLKVPEGWTSRLDDADAKGETFHFTVSVPAGAKPSSSPADAVLPFPPALVSLDLRMSVDDYDFTYEKAVESAEAKTTAIVVYPLELVPAVTLTVEPAQVMVPEKRAGAPVDLLARVRYHGTKPASVSIGLDAPQDWNASPIAALDFKQAGDQLVRYVVRVPAKIAPGAYTLRPYAKLGDDTFRTSVEPIPTLPARNFSQPADVTVHMLDLTVPAGLHIGYIAGDNDVLPETLRQVGIQVDLLDEVTLAFGDLSRFDAIVAGIRAYELRPDAMAANPRLLEYVHNGGTLLVLYERDFAWAKLLPAPFRAEMDPKGAVRVTDQNSPVRFLAPDSPLLNSPNKITLDDFKGWEQERGLYFWSTWDSRYQPVLGLTDPGEPEATGGLVYAHDGKGLYIYTGLSFFRELPDGVPGAYRLFVNLLSQTLHSAARK